MYLREIDYTNHLRIKTDKRIIYNIGSSMDDINEQLANDDEFLRVFITNRYGRRTHKMAIRKSSIESIYYEKPVGGTYENDCQ